MKQHVDNSKIDDNNDESENIESFSEVSIQAGESIATFQYLIMVDESKPDRPLKVWFNTFDLCYEKREFIEIHSSATINPTCFHAFAVNYVQCDHCFGGEFTSFHDYTFDQENTEKLYQSLYSSYDPVLLSKLIQKEFSGVYGLKLLETYCNERNIKYNYTFESRE